LIGSTAIGSLGQIGVGDNTGVQKGLWLVDFQHVKAGSVWPVSRQVQKLIVSHEGIGYEI
jgi:hypothetical protein